MPPEPRIPELPQGLTRWFFRAPIWLYRMGLGWLLGERMLLLSHVGRKSGLARRAVLEVVRHEAESDSYIIVSGYGERSQWFQNLLALPDVTIQVGRRSLAVTAERLPPDRGAAEMVDYASRHPRAVRVLAGRIGYNVDDTEAGYRALGEAIPFLALRPR